VSGRSGNNAEARSDLCGGGVELDANDGTDTEAGGG